MDRVNIAPKRGPHCVQSPRRAFDLRARMSQRPAIAEQAANQLQAFAFPASCIDQTRFPFIANIPPKMTEGVMFTSSECCAIAEKKLSQAENDDRNRRRLVSAAESWLFLASRLNGNETASSIDTVIAKRRSTKRQKRNG